QLIEEYQVANIILFARNIHSIEQLSKLNRTIHQKVMDNTGLMPLIAIDQEGGIVTRIMSGATFCPGAMTLCATQPENANKIGSIMSEELSRLGINLNLAPVLDVNNNPKNPVIGVRSYSDDPKMVALMGVEFIKGMQKDGLLATAKHFPGHGDVIVDSHLGLPVIDKTIEEIQKVELVPFKKAIENGIKAIMSAHIYFTAYETNGCPATLSHRIMTGLLREELGFEGLIISDCMEMKAIDETVGAAAGAVTGIIAGLDMVCISHTLEKQLSFLNLMEQAIKDGRITEHEIDEKVKRILKAKKESHAIIQANFIDNFENIQYFPHLPHKKIAEDITLSSLTCVKGERFFLKDRTLLIATAPFAMTIAEDKMDTRNVIEAVRRQIPDITCLKMELNQIDYRLINEVSNYDTVIICSYNAVNYKKQAKMINTIINKATKTFVISMRNPYDYLVLDNVKNYLALYEYTPNSVQAVVEYLAGNLTPRGKMPITLKRAFNIFASVYVGLPEYPREKNFEYMEFLKERNINTIFISAHMPEVLPDFLEDLTQTIQKANELGLKVILDVSKKVIDRLGIPKGIYSLRLDWGFSCNDVLELSKHDFFIEINASIARREEIEFLISRGIDFSKLRISHNFYPKPYTGLSQKDVLSRNLLYKSLGLHIMAYVPSRKGKRPPIFEGLPTVEEHRHLDLLASLADLSMLEVDEVCFGDAYCTEEELLEALDYNRDLITIPLMVYEGISDVERAILEKVHINRTDENPYAIRSSIREINSIPAFNTTPRRKMMVTIDNEHFLRYQGELSIMRQDLPCDARVNVIGEANMSDYLLENIRPGQQFRFMVRGVLPWKK
ncbi:MAG: beta-N-acetylhexosaminidase, partial [Bacilli bacterium]